jgi:hypothetical protein
MERRLAMLDKIKSENLTWEIILLLLFVGTFYFDSTEKAILGMIFVAILVIGRRIVRNIEFAMEHLLPHLPRPQKKEDTFEELSEQASLWRTPS